MSKKDILVLALISVIVFFILFKKKRAIGSAIDSDDFDGQEKENWQNTVLEFERFKFPNGIINANDQEKNDEEKQKDCMSNPYIQLTLPNPSSSPITFDLTDQSSYLSALNAQTTPVKVGTNVQGSVFHNGILYTVETTGADTLLAFDTNSNQVISSTPLGSPISGTYSSVVLYNGNIYLAEDNFIEVYSTVSNSIIASIPVPAGRTSDAIAIVKNKLFANVSGGAGNTGCLIIDLATNLLISFNVLGVGNLYRLIYPLYNANQGVDSDYVFLGELTTNNIFAIDTTTNITQPAIVTSNIAHDVASLATNSSGYLYVPQLGNMCVIDPVLLTVVTDIPFAGQGSFSVYNGQNTVYVPKINGNMAVFDTATDTLITTIPIPSMVGFSQSILFNNGLIYSPDNASGLVFTIGAVEGTPTYNTITQELDYSPASGLKNPVAYVGTNGLTNIVISNSGTGNGYLINQASLAQLSPALLDNFRRINYAKSNPTRICGMLYSCISDLQLSQQLAFTYTNVLGNVNTHVLLPVIYKQTQQTTNKIFTQNFPVDFIIDNDLTMQHTILAGEVINIYWYMGDMLDRSQALVNGKLESKPPVILGEKEENEELSIEEAEMEVFSKIHVKLDLEEEAEKEDFV